MSDRKAPRVYTARGPAEGEDWAAVATALNERMSNRRIGQQQLAELSGVSVSTVRLLQHGAGRRVQNKTLVSIARALEWPDDHLIQVLLSAPPVGDHEASELTGREILTILARVEDRLTEIVTRLAAVEQAVTSSDERTSF
ncbi:helix-turn-helix transcriptional regulator [Parafrankia sp. BMG5.11]|uniref:helix-turn-helix domain-containing protein n=1 Tax=Parafrankia sp. BMG5.11 TaxID=222540 RepID=UPI00103FF89F|nr:helix-turn-helix transcriptional regulator [Parafrankia sp. BMG5.11]TCJ34069.1 XRE family transcriptional regulator [Parafrankia sp. BMG5.11]